VGIRATPIAEALLALVVMDHACASARSAVTWCCPARHSSISRGFTRGPRAGLPACAGPPGSRAARFGALSFAYFAAIGLFNPYAPLWFQSLGLSTLVIGAIASLQSWTRIVAPYAWSWAATTAAAAPS
jgi:hypothetical protein